MPHRGAAGARALSGRRSTRSSAATSARTPRRCSTGAACRSPIVNVEDAEGRRAAAEADRRAAGAGAAGRRQASSRATTKRAGRPRSTRPAIRRPRHPAARRPVAPRPRQPPRPPRREPPSPSRRLPPRVGIRSNKARDAEAVPRASRKHRPKPTDRHSQRTRCHATARFSLLANGPTRCREGEARNLLRLSHRGQTTGAIGRVGKRRIVAVSEGQRCNSHLDLHQLGRVVCVEARSRGSVERSGVDVGRATSLPAPRATAAQPPSVVGVPGREQLLPWCAKLIPQPDSAPLADPPQILIVGRRGEVRSVGAVGAGRLRAGPEVEAGDRLGLRPSRSPRTRSVPLLASVKVSVPVPTWPGSPGPTKLLNGGPLST